MKQHEIAADSVANRKEKAVISVVMPIYNGEKYLRSTLDSLLSQSFENFEAICADDCSTDGSWLILEEYARRDCRITPLKVPKNLGAAARVINFAIPSAAGDFFVYSSQDDLYSEDWLARMYQRQQQTGADAVIPDIVFYYEKETSRNWSMIGLHGDHEAQLTGREALVKSLDWSIAGNALWSMDIIRKHGFEEFAANSDEYSVRRFFLHCNLVAFSEGTFFYRQDNENAITKRKSPNSFDWPYTQLRVAELLQKAAFPTALIDGEVRNAIAAMSELKNWLESNRKSISAEDLDLMAKKVRRFEERLASDHAVSVKQIELQKKRPSNELLAKWRRSFKKLPAKLGRLLGQPA